MSFYGSSFSFDGRSCEEFGLMLYDFNTTEQGSSSYASGMDIVEDRVVGRYRSILYNTRYKDPLEFKLVFGANDIAARNGQDIDRQEMELIGSWLTGHSTYKWLAIDQPDLENIRYRCILTDLEMLEYAGNKWAFQCDVHCDSPYAYRTPEAYSFTVDGSQDIIIRSRSSMNELYYPKVEISLKNCKEIEIANVDTGDTFSMADLPSASLTMKLDGENGIIESNNGENLYPYCNFHWPSLKRGINHITLTGKGDFTFTCEFPVNVGG